MSLVRGHQPGGTPQGITLLNDVDCWVFTANFAGTPVTFWIDKRTRALQQQLMQPAVGLGLLLSQHRRNRARVPHGGS